MERLEVDAGRYYRQSADRDVELREGSGWEGDGEGGSFLPCRLFILPRFPILTKIRGGRSPRVLHLDPPLETINSLEPIILSCKDRHFVLTKDTAQRTVKSWRASTRDVRVLQVKINVDALNEVNGRYITCVITWLVPWVGKMNQIACCEWLVDRERWSYLARSGQPAVARKKHFP